MDISVHIFNGPGTFIKSWVYQNVATVTCICHANIYIYEGKEITPPLDCDATQTSPPFLGKLAGGHAQTSRPSYCSPDGTQGRAHRFPANQDSGSAEGWAARQSGDRVSGRPGERAGGPVYVSGRPGALTGGQVTQVLVD